LSIPCPDCGRLNRPGARYCASCQAPLGGAVAAARLQPGQLLDGGAYRVVQPLGKGGMGAVWLLAQTKAFDRLAVLKEVVEYFDPSNASDRQKALERFEAEARTLGDLKHPGIPDLYAYFSEHGHNYLVMEYIEGPDLRKWLTREDEDTGNLLPGQRLPVDDVLRYVIQICAVLEYLAGRQPPVVHNDVKPGNIIIDEHSTRAVLVDFGTAKTRYLQVLGKPQQKRDSIYGTVGYAAPELYQGRSEPRSDVYSLAATAYHLLTDDDPRDHPGQYPQLGNLPPALVSILEAALEPAVEGRSTASEFRQSLEGYLAGQTAPLRALTFPDGDEADERDELLALAIKHWNYATGILRDGTVAHWLRRSLHDPVAAQAADAAVAQWSGNPDAALDAFIRALRPGVLPSGKMELRTSSLRLPQVGSGQQILQQIEIANSGRGYLRGEILSTQAWLKVKPSFSCPPGQVCAVPVEIDTADLAPARSYLGAVTLTPVGGSPEVVAVQVTVLAEQDSPVQITMAAAAIEVVPKQVDLGVVDRNALSTPRAKVTVTNVSRSPSQVRVQGAPRWLLVKPGVFRLVPGAKQQVELVGRVDKVRGRREQATLTFSLDGGRNQEVEVLLEVKRRGLFG
jgi:tRNA A-37 threonylcarbamoyl transferase component Bud32